jgi:hypothetical protein
MGFLGSLFAGLEIPIAKHFTIRPEASANCTMFAEDAGWLGTIEVKIFWFSIGVALVF